MSSEILLVLLFITITDVFSKAIDLTKILEDNANNHHVNKIHKRSPKPLDVGYVSFGAKNMDKLSHGFSHDARLIEFAVRDYSKPLTNEIPIDEDAYKTSYFIELKNHANRHNKQLNHGSSKTHHAANGTDVSSNSTGDSSESTERPDDDLPEHLVNVVPISQHVFQLKDEQIEDDYDDTTPTLPSRPKSTLDESGEIPYRDTLGGLGIGFTYGGQGAGHGFFAG